MLVIALQGGLGNQMFQYAFASILAKKNDTKVLIDDGFFKREEKTPGFTPRKFELAIFNNQYTMASDSDVIPFHHFSKLNNLKKNIGLNYPKIYNESSFDFQTEALLIKSPVYLKGYFQSYKYWINYEDLVRNNFSFPIQTLDDVNKELYIELKNKNTISVHIRRGDYVEDLLTQQFHGNCSLDYYLEAIKILVSKSKDFTLVFFSDDSNWVKEQFKDLPYSKIFMDHNKEGNSWKDMLLMSSCSHNIIANSSFSWWAAWLNGNTCKTVIAPKNWFAENEKSINDLIPPEWTRL